MASARVRVAASVGEGQERGAGEAEGKVGRRRRAGAGNTTFILAAPGETQLGDCREGRALRPRASHTRGVDGRGRRGVGVNILLANCLPTNVA